MNVQIGKEQQHKQPKNDHQVVIIWGKVFLSHLQNLLLLLHPPSILYLFARDHLSWPLSNQHCR